MSPVSLPLPRLEGRGLSVPGEGSLAVLTDDALYERTGTRIAFTERTGGTSAEPYDSLNLAFSVDDSREAVEANIARLTSALGAGSMPLIRPKQVHGTQLVVVASADPSALAAVAEQAAEGADGVVVAVPDVAALLCFADCVPVILAAPSGAFAVVHAGWRGAIARICSKAAGELARAEVAAGAAATADQAAAQMNAYVGPHIRSECFECAPDLCERFAAELGAACAPDERHVDLSAAVRADLESAGIAPERIADAALCTACNAHRFFSYRASGGICGRHGAFAMHEGRA